MFSSEVKKNAQVLYTARQDYAFQDTSNRITFETLKKYLKLSYDAQHSLDSTLLSLPRLVDGENDRYSKAVYACVYWLIEVDVPERFRSQFYSGFAQGIPESRNRGLLQTAGAEALSALFGKGANYRKQVTDAWESEWKFFGGWVLENIQRLPK